MTVSTGAIGWDAVIDSDGGFEVLPEGEYTFQVAKLEKLRHEPKEGGNLPECGMALITLKIDNAGNSHTAQHRLFMHESTIGFVGQFFASIGQKKKGIPLSPNWDAVTGSSGRLKAKIKKYRGNDQNEFEFISSEVPVASGSPTPSW